MADEIVNARVKQKVDTEENWLANPLILLEGEQGFVVDELGEPVNFKIGDGTKPFSDLPYWINYYSDVISHKIITFNSITTPQVISGVFKPKTNLYDIVVINTGGADFDFKIGTSVGGEEVGSFPIEAGNNIIDLKYLPELIESIHFSGYDGNEISVIVIYFDYTENPVIPPTPGAPTAFRFPKGFGSWFMPIGAGHLEQCFDMITGLGVEGSPYENCQICGSTNPYINLERAYPMGYAPGLTLGSPVGNASNMITISQANLPAYDVEFRITGIVHQRGNTGSTFRWLTGIGSNISGSMPGSSSTAPWEGYHSTSSISVGGSGVSMDIRPNSKVVLYFLAIAD